MSKWIKKLTEAYSEVNENTKMANAKALAKATASSEKGKAAVTLPKAPFDIPKKAEKMPIAKKEEGMDYNPAKGEYNQPKGKEVGKKVGTREAKDVNELNKSTLSSYIKKAADDGARKRFQDVNIYKRMGDDENAAKSAKKAKNRTAGIATAADKLAKEAMDPVNHKALKGKHKDRDDTDIDNDGDTDASDKYLHKRRKAISKNVKGGDEVEMNPKKKKDKGAATANADAEMAESTLPSVYARILENRAAHYKKAAPAQDKEDGMAPMTKKAKADMEAGAKMDDTEEKGHVDAAKAGRAGPARKPRRNDNMKGDKAIISSATKMKEAFAAVYSEAKLPGAFALGDHAGHGSFGTKKQNHPDGSATLKLKLSQDHAKDKDGAHAYATKAADKLKSKGYNVHKVSVRKSEGGFGQEEHTASIHLSHNKPE